MLRIPSRNILIPILIPTLYLWIVDTLALRRGTWVIEKGTKYNFHVWDGLEIEYVSMSVDRFQHPLTTSREALFFLFTNCLVVFGLVAFDHTVAIFHTFPEQFPHISTNFFSPIEAMKALLTPVSSFDTKRITGLQQAIIRLKKKSRSFYIASGAFEGPLRIDLILLYSFCRVADDLVDNATNNGEARQWIMHLQKFLDLAYASTPASTASPSIEQFVEANFPADTQRALLQLPVSKLTKQPLCELLKGFEMDLRFEDTTVNNTKIISPTIPSKWPIETETILHQYAAYVAGTVAQLCIELALHHGPATKSAATCARIEAAGLKMGRALQLVNIARDIAVDAAIRRIYIPTSWLAEFSLTPEEVVKNSANPTLKTLRSKLLDEAFALYEESRGAIEELPLESRGPMRVAVESYMEIGRILRSENYTVKAGRATVPKTRRLIVAWRALNR